MKQREIELEKERKEQEILRKQREKEQAILDAKEEVLKSIRKKQNHIEWHNMSVAAIHDWVN